jgi:SAM-dependent methyltransferase
MASNSRIASNRWLRRVAKDITGDVLSIGSLSGDKCDMDAEGDIYKHYFPKASSYITSDVSGDVELILDVRDIHLPDGRFNCIYCDGVLEHVDDWQKGLKEMTRILANKGILILGLPFRQALHTFPDDYWRFTPYGIEYMLRKDFNIIEMKAMDNRVKNFATAYMVKAIKK